MGRGGVKKRQDSSRGSLVGVPCLGSRRSLWMELRRVLPAIAESVAEKELRLPPASPRRDQVFLPPIGGLTAYIFGDPSLIPDENIPLTVRVHDECNGSDVFGRWAWVRRSRPRRLSPPPVASASCRRRFTWLAWQGPTGE